jgi:hypothetical protein
LESLNDEGDHVLIVLVFDEFLAVEKVRAMAEAHSR